MKRVIAIDPGTAESAVVWWDGSLLGTKFASNAEILDLARDRTTDPSAVVAIEMVACYGMTVGKEVFETCLMIGRLQEAFEARGMKVGLIYRRDIKMHLCGSAKAKDANIRQALIDKLGPVGTKKNKGTLYGISGHLWAALAVADFAMQPGDLFQ